MSIDRSQQSGEKMMEEPKPVDPNQEFKSKIESSLSRHFQGDGWKVEAGRVILGGYEPDFVLSRGERVVAVEVRSSRKGAIDFMGRALDVLQQPELTEVMAVLPSGEADEDLLNLANQIGCGVATADPSKDEVKVLKWGSRPSPSLGLTSYYYFPTSVRKGEKFALTMALSNKTPLAVTKCVMSFIQSFPFEPVPGGKDRYAIESVADGILAAFTIPIKVADDAPNGNYALVTKFERSGAPAEYHRVDISVY